MSFVDAAGSVTAMIMNKGLKIRHGYNTQYTDACTTIHHISLSCGWRKYFANGAFLKRRRHNNNVIFLSEVSSDDPDC